MVTGGNLRIAREPKTATRACKRVLQRTHGAVVAAVHPRWRSRRGDRVGLGAVRCGVRCIYILYTSFSIYTRYSYILYMFGFGGWPQT